MLKNNRPSHVLYITDRKNKQRKTRAGAAWTNDNGWMSLTLNPGIHLSYEEQDKYFFSLYPTDQEYVPATGDKIDDEDDIPF